jgi:hypothetical protein
VRLFYLRLLLSPILLKISHFGRFAKNQPPFLKKKKKKIKKKKNSPKAFNSVMSHR